MRVKPVKHVQLVRNRAGEWFWRIRYANWRTGPWSGQAYASLDGAMRAAVRDFPDLPKRIKHRPVHTPPRPVTHR